MTEEKMKTVIIIPTYNEVGHIEKLISQILYFQPEADILVVDDNSPDGTGELIYRLSKNSNKIMLLQRNKKGGIGGSYIAGFKYVLSRPQPYERIIQMDADFSHHPIFLESLLTATKNKDFSIGSRYIRGSKIVSWSLGRRILSYLANIYVSFCLGLKIKDCTSGFRCFKRDILASLEFDIFKSNSYFFQIEILSRCVTLGYSYVEIPIIFYGRRVGKSKFGLVQVWSAILDVLRLQYRKLVTSK